ncbi:hypothetical protein [Streptomyces sp. NPDC094468]|uniref:hypothetical protein n=1 Tax=Streptomyces sp. NPDC094468 TaxID=3366066 RepID=UPI0037F7222D
MAHGEHAPAHRRQVLDEFRRHAPLKIETTKATRHRVASFISSGQASTARRRWRDSQLRLNRRFVTFVT